MQCIHYSHFYKGQITGYKFKIRTKLDDLINTEEINNYEFDLKPDNKKIIDLIIERNPELKDLDFEKDFNIQIDDQKKLLLLQIQIIIQINLKLILKLSQNLKKIKKKFLIKMIKLNLKKLDILKTIMVNDKFNQFQFMLKKFQKNYQDLLLI